MKRIPTIIGLILVVVLIGATALTTSLAKNVTSLFSRASSDRVMILPAGFGNVSDSGFTVYWIGAQKEVGVVKYGRSTSVSEGSASDDGQSASHFIRVANLKPGTKYYFQIAGDTMAPVGVTTKVSSGQQTVDPAFGKIQDNAGVGLSQAIVVLETKSSPEEKVAAISTSDGNYVLPAKLEAGQEETVRIYSAAGQVTTITCRSGQDKPLPVAKIGESLDCLQKTSGFKLPSGSTPTPAVGGDLEINLKDRETVSSPLPTVSGKAGPSQMVQIEIHSPVVYSGTVLADPNGDWSWTPPSSLTPGQHTATITIANPDGTTQKLTRTFFVSADTSILPVTSGTPSATISRVEEPATPAAVTPPPPAIVPATPSTGALENTLLILGAGLAAIIIGFGLIL